MAANDSNIVFDALADFALGVNSGLDPFQVPNNQLSFAVNATVRGNFVTNRPPYQLHSLGFVGGQEIQTAMEGGLFQGATYYAPDAGPQQLIAQIGGRLFAFTPNVSSYETDVVDISIPGDFNPANAPQAWLRQAERWVIVNNGLSVPIFYDGVSSRRSLPLSVVQGTSILASQPFTPAINGTMVLTLSAPYTGPMNIAVQLVEYDVNDIVSATTSYVVVAAGGGYTSYFLTLKNLGDLAGAVQGVDSEVVINPNAIGNIITASLSISANISTLTATKASIILKMSSPAPSSVHTGGSALQPSPTYLNIAGDSGWKVVSISSDRLNIKVEHLFPVTSIGSGPFISGLSYTIGPGPGSIGSISVGGQVFIVGSNFPSVIVGRLSANVTAPAVGATVLAQVDVAYTYSFDPVNGQLVYLNGHQYRVVGYSTVNTPPGTPTVTLQNLNDSRAGHQFNFGDFGYFPAQIFNFPELPPGRMGDYGQGRFWESLTNGISFIAGDGAGGPSGSPAYNYRDAVLKVSENALLLNGGFFFVPSNLGLISAMKFTSQPDTSLGQGPLMVVTPGGIFSCAAPADRTLWSQVTNPIVSDALIGLGGLGQNSTIVVNSDLMFRSVDGIRSLIMAKRDFWSWGNAPISFEMKRILDKDNTAGLPFTSAVQFDNRMLMTCSPVQGTQGVYSQGLIALNMDPVSSLQGKGASVYDGLWTGLNILQIIEGQFSGVHRCFAFTFSTTQNKIQLYEILKDGHLDNGVTPITWSFESPSLFRKATSKGFFDLVSLEDCEFYVKDIKPGEEVDFKVEYQPDFSNCWYPWHEFSYCNDPNSSVPIYGARLGLGKPPQIAPNRVNYTSANFGRWFRQRYTFVGHCVFMGEKVMAARQPETAYARPRPRDADATTSISATFLNQALSLGPFCAGGKILFSGNLPRWISIINSHYLLGSGGVFTGDTQQAADDAAAQGLLDFYNQSTAAGTLTCGAEDCMTYVSTTPLPP